MARLVIFGAGDIARLAHVYFTRDSEHEVVGFTIDGAYRQADTFRGLPLVDFEEITRRFPPEGYALFVALSYAQMNRLRAARVEQGRQLGYQLPSYVSSRCTVLTEEPIGDNCFILEDNTIQPFATIGHNVTLWSGNHIGHDVVVEDHCFISSHVVLSGYVRVGARSFLGVNATIRNGVTIAPGSLIGAGVVIVEDTQENSVYASPRALKVPKSSDDIEL
jgi:sugar O-acyltransferase (sialic acid O-acetyltransferase NeuD family)